MAVKIITDSTSDIPPEMATNMGITVIPLTVSFGNEHFLDNVTLKPDEFYRRLSQSGIYPQTTQPSPAVFKDNYEKLMPEAEGILVITISSKLSGTYQSALSAVNMLENPTCPVEVIDSQTVSLALGLLAVKASELARSGKSLAEIKEAITQSLPDAQPLMFFDTLTYLQKGGRIGRAQSMLGSLLSVKPLLTVRDGVVTPLTRVRSLQAGMDQLYNFAAQHSTLEYVGIGYATSTTDALKLKERLAPLFPPEKIYITQVGPVVGTYTGPNTLCLNIIGKSR
ncbi:fatty acid-binding protein DegV [Dehalococcoides mccartyi CG4]|uniref:DegV family protein n=1 Tax=Dehalococcoides mccartyi TaxID=61435 RepID=UPI0004E05212|nr:DegV family protein [Dehalococcoides mccartyi]AII59819.1 fatty acid-binding protein DegV [Dehalococcoides mccartyi CG4]